MSVDFAGEAARCQPLKLASYRILLATTQRTPNSAVIGESSPLLRRRLFPAPLTEPPRVGVSCHLLRNTRSKRERKLRVHSFGLWLSLVERLVRDQEAVGSNPTSPMKLLGRRGDRAVAAALDRKFKFHQPD